MMLSVCNKAVMEHGTRCSFQCDRAQSQNVMPRYGTLLLGGWEEQSIAEAEENSAFSAWSHSYNQSWNFFLPNRF